MVEVVQADRDRAAEQGLEMHNISPGEASAIRAGEWDDLPRVQAFASHRIAATEPLRDALERLLDTCGARDLMEAAERAVREYDETGAASSAAVGCIKGALSAFKG